MKAFLLIGAVIVGLLFCACDSGSCDRLARVPCDNAVSTCISNCPETSNSAYLACFDTQCLPALCTCLNSVECAYEEPNCDGMY